MKRLPQFALKILPSPANRVPLICALFGIFITTAIWQASHRQNIENQKRQSESETRIIEQQIDHALSERVRSLERMAARLAGGQIPSRAQWQEDANNFLAHFTDITSLAIIDAKAIIRDIAPIEKYRSYISSLNFDRDQKRKAALTRAYEKQKATITGLVELKSGGEGIVIVTPILSEKTEKRALLAVIQTEPFFSRVRVNPGFEIEIREENEVVYRTSASSKNENLHSKIRKEANVFGVGISVIAHQKTELLASKSPDLPIVILVFGYSFSILLFLTIRFALSARSREAQAMFINRKLDSILSTMPVAIYETNWKGECTFVNRTWEEYTGMSKSQALGSGWKSAIHPDDRAELFLEWESCVREQRSFQLRYRFNNALDGSTRWVESRAEAVHNNDGETIGYLGAAIDSSKQIAAERKLAENNDFLSIILEALPVALYCKDRDQNFSYTLWNKAAEKIWGIPRSMALGAEDFSLFPAADAIRIRERDLRTISAETEFEGVETISNKLSCDTYLVKTKNVPVPDFSGHPRFILGISEDVTQMVKTEKQLEEQKLKIIQTERMTLVGEMAAGVAHEINNPLTIIDGHAHQIRKLLTADMPHRERLLKAIDGISNTSLRIAKIIRGLKALARDGKNDPPELSPVLDLINEALELCQSRINKQGVRLEVQGSDHQLALECRKVQVSQVLLNLLNNALDATMGRPNSFIRIEYFDEGEMVRITVADSGPGVPKENLLKIMSPFFTTKDPNRGMGLGLSISSNIVRSHHGTLVINPDSEHTQFVITLPKRFQSTDQFTDSSGPMADSPVL